MQTAAQYSGEAAGDVVFAPQGKWVWDFWTVHDGDRFHLFYLFAPTALKEPELRHRNARIGHAVSADLTTWDDLGEVLAPGEPGAFDASATWTGSVIEAGDGSWRMFYTGAVFHSEASHANTETIGVAVSSDLHTWVKQPEAILRADGKWYERLGDSSWPEEAWRDPWVFRDEAGDGWHMLITARGNDGPADGRGVVGYAWSPDIETWSPRPPLGPRAENFPHLEVLQPVEVDGIPSLVFSALPNSNGHGGEHDQGVWVIDGVAFPGPYDITQATLLAGPPHYAGRVIIGPDGQAWLMASESEDADGNFIGRISDPMPLARDANGRLRVVS